MLPPVSSSASSLLQGFLPWVRKQHSARLELDVLGPPADLPYLEFCTPTPGLKSQSRLPFDLVASQKTLYLFAHPFPLEDSHGVAGATTGTVNLHLCHLLPVYLPFQV